MSAARTEFLLTPEGVETLQTELQQLTTTKRTEIAERLKDAMAAGDLSENAQYDAARDAQGMVEGRIAEIEHILKHTVLIKSGHKSTVDIGSTVHVELETGKQKYQIVGSTEANPDEGKISNESPIGRALLGAKAGDEVEVQIPSGTISYKILKVE